MKKLVLGALIAVSFFGCAHRAAQQTTLSEPQPSGTGQPAPDTAGQGSTVYDQSFGTTQRPDIFEGSIEPIPGETPDQGPQQAPPLDSMLIGGSVRIYAYHGFLDQAFMDLVQAPPCVDTGLSNPDSAAPAVAPGCESLLSVRRLSERRLELCIGERIVDERGKSMSSFDCAEKIAAHVKKHPAEGRALFRHVKGIDKFIAGTEAVIPGFRITDEKTIQIMLERPDPLALQRLSTARLAPAFLGLGPYRLSNVSDDEVVLVVNPLFPGRRPYLDTCDIVTGEDSDPVLSLLQGRYDCLSVVSTDEQLRANRESTDSITDVVIGANRYFIAVANTDPLVRQLAGSLTNAQELLNTAVRADGQPIDAIETDSGAPAPLRGRPETMPDTSGGPLVVLYNGSDLVSMRTAKKMIADIVQAGVPARPAGLTAAAYEQALINRSYDLAVGWVSQRVVADSSERLRLATIWFGDSTVESSRISSGAEIPLFLVKRHLLCGKQVSIDEPRLSRLYRTRATPAGMLPRIEE